MQKLSKIFRNPFFYGYITNQLIDGKVVKGIHEPIFSEEVFLKVNGLLNTGYKHQNENDALPLKFLWMWKLWFLFLWIRSKEEETVLLQVQEIWL